MEQYRVDPLTEEWRWDQLDPLTGASLPMLEIDQEEHLHIIGHDNQVHVYHPSAQSDIPLPDNVASEDINAFYRTSDGQYCVVTANLITWFDGSEWREIADFGTIRRVDRNFWESPNGYLWIGTDRGIVRVDIRTCETLLTKSPKPVLSLCEGPGGGSLWVSLAPFGEIWECPLSDGKLAESKSWILRRKELDEAVPYRSLLKASDDRIWYINGHYTIPPSVYDPKEELWQDVDLVSIGGDNFNFSILETRDGTIWISSRGVLHALKGGVWKLYRSPEHPIPGARSLMAEGPDGYLYITETAGATVRIDYARKRGESFENLHYQATTASEELVFLSSEDEVLVLPKGADEATVYSPAVTGIAHPAALKVTQRGHYFLVGGHNGAAAVSIFDGTAWRPQYFPEFARTIGHLGVVERENGEIWVGNAQDKEQFQDYIGGILIFKPSQKDGYTISRLKPPAVRFRNWSLVEGPANDIYISGKGLFRFSNGAVQRVALPDDSAEAWIDQIALAANGDIWLAHWTLGVLRRHGDTWTQFTEADGMGSGRTSYITCLDGTFPVAVTSHRIYRFDGRRWAPYLVPLGGLYRGSGQLLQARDGSVWMNRTHVDWYYRGQREVPYAEDKKRGFRTIQYIADNHAPVTHWIESPPDLVRGSSVTIRFNGRDGWARTSSEDLQFSYRLNGGSWSPFSSTRELQLDGLEGGPNSVEVIARDSDFNIEINPLRADFRVVIPLWEQNWFIPSVVGAILMVILSIALVIRQRFVRLLEIEQIKMRIFTHVSHELKNPLNLILGPVERLQNQITDSNHQHYLWLIKSNSQRLLYLVNQLLDFRSFQSKKLEYNSEKADLVPFAKSCIAVFQNWAADKNHDLAFESDLDSLVFPFDQDVFQKIIDNLTNNAVKYTPPGGRIRIRVKKTADRDGGTRAVIEVEDNGPGILPADRKAIFEPFYRSPRVDQNTEGSGVGLSLVKEMVEAVKGELELISPVYPESEDRPGSCFRISIPIVLDATASETPLASRDPAKEEARNGQEPGGAPADAPAPASEMILLIEDNDDLRDFMKDGLSTQFKVETAINGEEGIDQARKLMPDLIISDVVMPGMNGFQMSAAIKSDPRTSHIPIILLTTLRSDEHKRQAYKSGADDFVNKPISGEILRLKIRNLLDTQKRSRERIHQQFVEDHRITGLAEADQAFLDKVDTFVEEHLGDEELNVDLLASKMGFSRSAFYRKFQSLTDMSPAAYIRTKRLRKAAQWLAEGTRSVTEIAFDAGFSDSGYFSRVFKSEYKCSPSEFAKKSRETSPPAPREKN